MADRPTERRRLDQMTDDDLDQLHERLRKAERAANLLAYAHRRAERAEQQLAEVRALHQPEKTMAGTTCTGCLVGDPFEAHEWPCPTIAALDEAQQPECSGCGDTGACTGGPCAHPDATWESHEASGDSHDGAQQPGQDGCECQPEREHGDYTRPAEYLHAAGCRAAAEPARQDGHTGACEAPSVPGGPTSPTEAPTGRQAGAESREEGQS